MASVVDEPQPPLFGSSTRVVTTQETLVYLAPAGEPRSTPQPAGRPGTTGTTPEWVDASWWYWVSFDIGMDGFVPEGVLAAETPSGPTALPSAN